MRKERWPARAFALILAALSIVATSRAQTNEITAQAPVSKPVALAPAAPKSWTDYVTVKGDMRLRLETINDDSKKNSQGENYMQDRARIRARLKAEAKVDDLKAGLGLSTGGADPVSGNTTLGDGFTKKEIRLDLAYIDYTFLKDDSYGLAALGGKINNPMIMLPDDLIWDSDLNPEGVAAKATFGNDFVTCLVNGEGLFIQERSSEKNATGLGGQVALKFRFMPEVALTVGGTYYAFQNFEGYNVIDWQNNNNSYGNSTIKGTVSGGVTNKAWACGFTPVIGIAQLDLYLGLPISFYGQLLTNPDADANKNGYMGGVSLGKAKNPRTFEVGYSYTELEKDATLGMFTDSDRWGGGTDGKGSKFYGKYQIMKNLQACVTFFLDQKKISAADGGTDYNRLQLDVQASF